VNRLGNSSIRLKVLAGVAPLVLVSGLIILLLARALMVRNLQAELRQHGLSIAQGVAEVCVGPVLCPDREGVDRLLRQLARRNPDLRYAFASDSAGHILASIVSSDLADEMAVVYALDPANTTGRTAGVGNERIWESQAIIRGEQEEGWVRVGMGEREMWLAVSQWLRPLFASLMVVMVVSIVAASALTWLLTRPIVDLAAATERMGRGDYSARSHYQANDEIGELSRAFNRAAEQMAQAEAERAERQRQRQFYLQRIIQAQEEERRRVARELHDETGQALTALMVGLRNVEEAANESEMRVRLDGLRQVLAGALAHVRQLAYDLRPAVLDDLGLGPALRRYAEGCQDRFGIRVGVQTIGIDDQRLSPELETTVYRIVQEAILNAARHARCARIDVLVQAQNGQVVAIVEDDGLGFDPAAAPESGSASAHLGLFGMRERAELVGGSLEVESAPGRGCTIYLRAPLEVENLVVATSVALAQVTQGAGEDE
jgi:signal transduction histidine kinase